MSHRLVLWQVSDPEELENPAASPSVCVLSESLGTITIQVCLDKDQDLPEAGCQIAIEAADLLEAVSLLQKSAARAEKRFELEAPLRERAKLKREAGYLRLNLARTQRRKQELIEELERAQDRVHTYEELERRVDEEVIRELSEIADGEVDADAAEGSADSATFPSAAVIASRNGSSPDAAEAQEVDQAKRADAAEEAGVAPGQGTLADLEGSGAAALSANDGAPRQAPSQASSTVAEETSADSRSIHLTAPEASLVAAESGGENHEEEEASRMAQALLTS